jgi:hypothetical protein
MVVDTEVEFSVVNVILGVIFKKILHPRTRLLTVQTSDTLTCLTLYHLFLFSSSYLFLGAFGVTDRLIVIC